MGVTDDLYTFLSLRTMFTQSFPPADNLIQQLSKIEYKKLYNQFVTIILTIAAVVYVLSQKIAEWYSEGGKDLIVQTIKKVWNFLQICYIWIHSEGYPQLIKFTDKVLETYDSWKNLVTV